MREKSRTAFTMASIITLISLAVIVGGCDRDGADPAEVNPAGAEQCPGATPAEAAAEYHPRVLRGRVHAPFGKLAVRSSFPTWLVSTAYAAPLESERTVPEATVVLYRVGPAGQKVGEALRETTTDMAGQWCMKLPQGVELAAGAGAELMLAASAHDTRLRRSLVSEVSTDLYSTAEALTRLLIEYNVDFSKIPVATYLNMESIADTRVDLLEAVELEQGATVESTVRRILKVLAKDERLMEKIDKLPTLK
jgi:hypothetical protein